LGETHLYVNTKLVPNLTRCLEQQALGSDGKPEKKNDLDHLCFSGETLVATPSGAIAFKDLPESGLVFVANGKIAKYINCGIKKTLVQTVRVTLENGKTIECTPDHKFLTECGWCEAQHLLNQQILCSKSIPQYQGNFNFLMGLNTKGGAKMAALNLLSTNIIKSLDVRLRVRVVSVKPINNQDVYCLTVPNHGYFLLADGEIVKNCEALGYTVYWVLPVMGAGGFSSSRARI